ncbi:MAG: NRDE family protein [Myxococcota bacterium]|nr:NRDE family protein [Myxococcota bacterium]
MIDVVRGAPLVVAANRDELHAREARGPEILRAEDPRIVGGRDVLSGGTWLAVGEDARFAAVTNQRALVSAPPGLVSRGLVVIETVAAKDSDAYVMALDPTRYASMNLVWGDARGVKVAYLRREDGTREVVSLGRGIHVLCNDRIGSDGFPRGERLANAMAPLAGRDWTEVVDALPPLLGDHMRFDIPPPPHLPPALARELTATCIHTEHYGTRSATILALAPDRVLSYRHADGPPCVTPFWEVAV